MTAKKKLGINLMVQVVADGKILSYVDVLLRASDVALLADREWLSDTLIEFYVEYLWKAVLREHPKIALIGPSIAFCLMHCQTDDERKTILSSLHLPRKEVSWRKLVLFRKSSFFFGVGSRRCIHLLSSP